MKLRNRQWPLRKSIIITFAILAVLTFVCMLAINNLFISPTFINIEKQQSQQKIEQVSNTLQYRLTQIAGKVQDWSSWDETYNFVQTRNQTYIENNLLDTMFESLNINLIIIIDNNGQIIYSSAYNLQNNTRLNVSEETNNVVSQDSLLWNFSKTNDQIMGITLLDQPTMIASKPILTSTSEGPIQGTLIFGVYLDEHELSDLVQITGLSFTITSFYDPAIQNSAQLTQSLLDGQVVTSFGTDTITSTALFIDIHSNPAIVVEVNQDNSYYVQGLSLYNSQFWAVLLIGSCFVMALMFLYEKAVFAPLKKITEYVTKFPLDPNQVEVPKFRTTELSVLSSNIKDSMTQRLDTIGELAGWVGHDLRNPLTGIKAGNYYLKKKYSAQMDAAGIATLETIDSCIEYSNKIVNDLLDYSSKTKLELNKTSPKQLVGKALSILKIPDNIQVVDETDDTHLFLADIDKMERVINNLVMNAFDAMPNGGKLIITSQKTAKNVETFFIDNGMGMSKETLSRLWTPLFTTKAKGMGFGLAICKKIVDAHDGKLRVESTLGKGTTFKITMPSIQNSL